MNLKTQKLHCCLLAIANSFRSILIICLLLPISQFCHATDSAERLQTSVSRLNHWLGSSPSIRSWRVILDLNSLDSQAAKGPQADPQKLRAILARFESRSSLLQYPVFYDACDSVRKHAEQIERTQSWEFSDLQSAAFGAIQKYQPTATRLNDERHYAIRQLRYLKQLYRRELPQQQRLEYFSELGVDANIKFLQDLDIDLLLNVDFQSPGIAEPDEAAGGDQESSEHDPDLDENGNFILKRVDFICGDLDAESDSGAYRISVLNELCSIRARFRSARKLVDVEKINSIVRKLLNEPLPDFNNSEQLSRVIKAAVGDIGTDPALVAACNALDGFTEHCRFSTEQGLESQFVTKVTELAELVSDLNHYSKGDSRSKIGSTLQWLESRLQLPDLCTAIKRRYSKPNLQFSVSNKIVQLAKPEPTSETERVHEMVLGRLARGTLWNTATPSLVLVDNPDQAQIAIMLNGTASTDTYVCQRKLRIDSLGYGCLSARQDLLANFNGLFASPISASAVMNNKFDGVSSRLKLIQRIANRAFNKQVPQVNAIASATATDRLEERFSQETSQLIDPLVDVVETFSQKYQALSAQIPPSFLRSTSSTVEAAFKTESWNKLAATTNPVFQSAGDIQIKVHESLINNYLDNYFSGLEDFTDKKWQNLRSRAPLPIPEDSGRDVPEIDFPTGEPDDTIEFSISFQKVRPIEVNFDGNRVTFIIRATKFQETDSDREIDQDFTLELRYRIESRGSKIYLILDSVPSIEFPNAIELESELRETVESLEMKLHNDFGEVILELADNIRSIVEIAKEKIPSGLLDRVQLSLLELSEGWLYIGWNLDGGIINLPAIEYRPADAESVE